MNSVPNIISTKDLGYIEDMFNWNFIASKKLNQFKDQVTDQQVKDIITKAHDMHTNACHTILTFIEGGNYEQ